MSAFSALYFSHSFIHPLVLLIIIFFNNVAIAQVASFVL